MYALPYILITAMMGVGAIFTQEKIDNRLITQRIWLACVGLLLFFFGFRGFICDDWQIYHTAFETCTFDDITFNIFAADKGETFEPLFTLWMWLCKSVIDNYFFFQFCCTLVNLILLISFLRRWVDNIPFSIVLFICFSGYVMMTNLMRNSIAILIFANALIYIQQRKPLPYFALCIIALGFHVSSLIYFPAYFFFHKKINKWIYLLIFIAGNVFFLGNFKLVLPIVSMLIGGDEGLLQSMVESYTTGDYEGATGISIGYLERLLTGILFFCYYDQLTAIREKGQIFINCFIAYFCLFFFLSEFRIMADRMSILFVLSYWILWSDLARTFYYTNNRRLFLSFITIYCTMKLVGMSNLVTSEYDNVLFGAKSYQERLYIHNRAIHE